MKGFCTASGVIRRIRYHTRWFTWFAFAVSIPVTWLRESPRAQLLVSTASVPTEYAPLGSRFEQLNPLATMAVFLAA
jgi:hypothetical protein